MTLSDQLCACGCGERTTVITRNAPARGYIKGAPNRFVKGHKVRPVAPIPERFWPKVERRASDACWEWAAHRTKDGYGTFWDGSSPNYAHRVSYELTVGPIPEGFHIDHLCRNPPCVNPAHLEPVTPRENWDRGLASSTKTECINGHTYDDANTYRRPDNGHRECRTCRREAEARSRARRAVA